jgi:hypothetical protein
LEVGFAELILTGGWFLWWKRRQLVHGENIQRPSRSGLSIASLAKNFVGSRKKNEDTPRLEETSRRLYYVKY